MSNGKTGPLLCTVCKKAGKRSKLQTYQINFDEAIILCENRETQVRTGGVRKRGKARTSDRIWKDRTPDLPSKDCCATGIDCKHSGTRCGVISRKYGKRRTGVKMPRKKTLGERNCPVCQQSGLRRKLVKYQINFDEAVVMCEEPKCTYPIDCQTPKEIILKRKFSDIKQRRQKRPRLPWDSLPNSPKSNSSIDSFPLESVRSIPRMQPARSVAMNMQTESVISSDAVSSSGQPVSDAGTQGQPNIVTVPQNSTFPGQRVVHVQTSTGAIVQLDPETAEQVLSGAVTLQKVTTSQPVTNASASQILFPSLNQRSVQSTVGSNVMQAQPQSVPNRYIQIQPVNLPPQTILSQANNVLLAAQQQAVAQSRGVSLTESLALSRSVPLVSSIDQSQTVSQSGSTSIAPPTSQPQTVVQSASVSVAQGAVQPQNVLQSVMSTLPSVAQSQTVSHFGSVSNASLAAQPQTINQSENTPVAQLAAQPQNVSQSWNTSSVQLAVQPSSAPLSPRRVMSVTTPEQQYRMAMLKRAILQHQLLQQRGEESQGVPGTPNQARVGPQAIDPNILSRLGQLGKGMNVSHVTSVAVPSSDSNVCEQMTVSMPQGVRAVDPDLSGDDGTGISVTHVASIVKPVDDTAPTSDSSLDYVTGGLLLESAQSAGPNPGEIEGAIVKNVSSGSMPASAAPTSEATSVTMPQSVQSNLLNRSGDFSDGTTVKQAACALAPALASSSTTPTSDMNPNIKYIEITIEQAAKIPGVTAEMLAEMRLQSQQGSKSPKVLIPFKRLKDIMNRRPETQIVHVDLTTKTQVPQSPPSRTPQVNLTSPRAQAVPLGRVAPKTAFLKCSPKPQTGALVRTVSVLQKPKISIEMKNTLPPTSQVSGIVTFSSSTPGGVKTVSIHPKASPSQPSVSVITTPQVSPATVAQSTASVVTSQTRNTSQNIPIVTSAAQTSAAPQLVFTDVACNPGDRFIQWRNEDALCWLDVVLSLLVFNKSIRSPGVMNKFDSTNVIRTICAAYDQALNIIRSPSWEDGSPVKPTGQVGCIKGMVGTGGGGTEVSTPSSLGSAEGGVLMEKFFDSIDTDKPKCDQTKTSSASGEVSNLAAGVEIPSETPSLPVVSSESSCDSQRSSVSLPLPVEDPPANSNKELAEPMDSNQTDTDNVVQMQEMEESASLSVSNCDEKLTPVVICDSDEMEAGDSTDLGQVPGDEDGLVPGYKGDQVPGDEVDQVPAGTAPQTSGQSDMNTTGSAPPAEMDTDESSNVVKQLEHVHLAGEVVDENSDAIDSQSNIQSETLPSASDSIPQTTTELKSVSAQITTPGQSNESSVADQNIGADAPSTLSQTVPQSVTTSASETSEILDTVAATVQSVSQSVSAASVVQSQTETKPAKKPSARFFVPVMASSDPNQQVRHIKFSRPLSADMKKILALPPEDRQAMVKDLTKEDKDELIHYYIQYLFPGLEIEQYFEARDIINGARDEMWTYLEPRLKCEKGKNDSPMIALYMVLSSIKALKANFLVNATWLLQCQICGKKKIERQSKTLITFPNVGPDWTMHDAYFVRACYFCGAPKQKRNMVVKDFPPSVALHFMEGLPSADLDTYDFTQGKYTYRVTGCIQYRKFPDHFITWLRDPKTNSWMECDDLKLPVCQYTKNKPSMQPSEVHIVVWERQEFYLGGSDPVQTDIADPEAEISMDSTASSNVSTSKSLSISSTSATLPDSSAVTSTPYFALTPPPPTSVLPQPSVPTLTSVPTDVQMSTAVMKSPEKLNMPQVVPTSPDVAIIGVSQSPDVAITHVTSSPDLVITHIEPPKQEVAAKRILGTKTGVRRRSADSSRSAPVAKVARLANTPTVSSGVPPTAQQTFQPVQSTSSSASSLSDSILSEIRDVMMTLPTQQNREFTEMIRQIQEIVTKYKLCLKRVAISGESAATLALKSQLQKSMLNIITRMPPSVGKGLFSFYQQEGLIPENLVLTIKHTSHLPGKSAAQLLAQTPGTISTPTSAAPAGIRPLLVPVRPASTASQGQSPVLRGQLTGATPRVEKSYLKLVQPLLKKVSPALGQKGQQKGQYAGYVPLSLRNPDAPSGTATTAMVSPAVSSMTASAAAAASLKPQTSSQQQPSPAAARPQVLMHQQPSVTAARPQALTHQQPSATAARPQALTHQQPSATAARPQPLTHQQPSAAVIRPQALSIQQQPLTQTAKKNIQIGIQQRFANMPQNVRAPVQRMITTGGQLVVLSDGQATKIIQQPEQRILGLSALRRSVPSSGVVARIIATPSAATLATPTDVSDERTIADLLRARDRVMATSSSPTLSSTPGISLLATSALRTSLHDAPSSDADTAEAIPVSHSSTTTVQSLTSVMTPLEASVAETLQQMASSTTGDVSTAFRTAAAAVISEAQSSCSSSAGVGNVEPRNVVMSMPVDSTAAPADIIQVKPQNTEMAMRAVPTSDVVTSTAPVSSIPVSAATGNVTPVQAPDISVTPSLPVQVVRTEQVLTASPEPVVSKITHEPAPLPVVSKMIHVPAGLPVLSSSNVTLTPPIPAPITEPEPAPAVVQTESTPMLISTADPTTISEAVIPTPVQVSAPSDTSDSVPSAAPVANMETPPKPVTRKKAPSPAPKVITPVAKDLPVPVVAPPNESLGLGKRVRRKPARFLDDDESDSSSISGKSPSRSSTGSSPKRARGNRRKQSVERSVSTAVLEVQSAGSTGRGRAQGRVNVEQSVSTPLLDVPILLGDDAVVHQRRGRRRASGRGRGKMNSPVAVDNDAQLSGSALLAQANAPVLSSAVLPTTSQTVLLASPTGPSQQTEQGRPRRQVKPSWKCLEGLTPQQFESLKQFQTHREPGEMVINLDNVQVGADGSLIFIQGVTSGNETEGATGSALSRSDSNDSSQDVTVISGTGDAK